MARDLIPPPSPAGRPSRGALHEAPAAGAPEAGEDATPPPRSPSTPSGPRPFRGRFGFLTGALIGVAACAAVAFAVLLVAGPPSGRIELAENWSSWKPSSSDPAQGAEEIAEHVAPGYRLDAGHQLVTVSGGPLVIQGAPVTVSLRPGDGTLRDLGANGVLYSLRGEGSDGHIVGRPSVARHALLRREALELALYSFRYLDGIDEVVALLPPTRGAAKEGKGAAAKPKGKPQHQAVLYRAGDLRHALEVPLARTLAPGPLTPDELTAADRRRIDELTLGNLFLASLQVPPDQSLHLVLSRPGA